MPNGIDRTLQATVIAAALCDIADACRAMGEKPPTVLSFPNASTRNRVSDALKSLAGIEGLRIAVSKADEVTVDGIGLKIRWD